MNIIAVAPSMISSADRSYFHMSGSLPAHAAACIRPTRIRSRDLRDLIEKSDDAADRFRRTQQRLNFLHNAKAILQEESCLRDLLDQLTGIGPIENNAQALDAFSKKDEREATVLATAVACLTPEEIFQSLGFDALIWSRLFDFYAIDRREAVSDFLADIGYPTTSTWPAFFNTTRPFVREKTSVYTSTLFMIQELQEGIAERIPLPELIKESPKTGIEISSKRAYDYSLSVMINPVIRHDIQDDNWLKIPDRHNSTDHAYRTWTDAPIVLIISYKGTPNLAISVRPLSHAELFIEQIQYVSGYRLQHGNWHRVPPRGMSPLDSMKLGMLAGEQLAAVLGFERTTCIGAANIRWTKIRYYGGQGDPHLPIEKARSMYDDTATALFEPTTDGNWSRPTNLSSRLLSLAE